jgi:hypothetical protein
MILKLQKNLEKGWEIKIPQMAKNCNKKQPQFT